MAVVAVAGDPDTARWPPSHSVEEIAATISDLASNRPIEKWFFTPVAAGDGEYCQGDIVQLRGVTVPVLDENGDAFVLEPPDAWLVLGNTCDFARSNDELPWTQLVPLYAYPDCPEPRRTDLVAYKLSRHFYVPRWAGCQLPAGLLVAEWTMPVTASKELLRGHGAVSARLSRHAWYLLNACLVRFCARDDGRMDAG